MNRTFHILVSLVCITIAAGQIINSALNIKCGPNEKYSCGPVCVETCTYKPTICPKICKFGCVCAAGYVRQSNKTNSACIKREQCPIVKTPTLCGTNEEYQECGTACPATCDDLRYPLPKPPKACIALCKSGCFCKSGYYRTAGGKCVPPEKCCGTNESFERCGSACVETCDYKPAACTKNCVIGCFCSCSSYVRQCNTTGSPCINRNDCPTLH